MKDPALSLQQLRSLLRHRFDPWPGNFHMPRVWPKKKKKKKKTALLMSWKLDFLGERWSEPASHESPAGDDKAPNSGHRSGQLEEGVIVLKSIR